MNDDALRQEREYVKRLLRDMGRVETCHLAISALIEKAASVEEVKAIGLAIIEAILVNNPRQYRQLDNGKWVLRNRKIVPFAPTA